MSLSLGKSVATHLFLPRPGPKKFNSFLKLFHKLENQLVIKVSSLISKQNSSQNGSKWPTSNKATALLITAVGAALLSCHNLKNYAENDTFEEAYRESPENLASRCGPYPALEPFRTGRLQVSATHELYFEESGSPEGKPVVVLHGGPGAGSSPGTRRLFDPNVYRIILFDQRGSGKSTPLGSVEDNTTWSLVEDIEKLRKHLGIEQWMVFGGSWGSTLALAYAETHPSRVTEMIVRGIFLFRKSELDFLFQNGASHIFPDAWELFASPIPQTNAVI